MESESEEGSEKEVRWCTSKHQHGSGADVALACGSVAENFMSLNEVFEELNVERWLAWPPLKMLNAE